MDSLSFSDPGTVFGFKMAVCLALFLIGAAWLARFAERVKRRRGPPPEGASARETLAHFFGGGSGLLPRANERRLYCEAVFALAREVERLDPGNGRARDALALLALGQAAAASGALAAEVGALDQNATVAYRDAAGRRCSRAPADGMLELP